MARDFKPTGDPSEVLAKQTEFAKKAFDITIQNTRDVAQLATQTTTDGPEPERVTPAVPGAPRTMSVPDSVC